MRSEILPLRHASRELVRELGFLQDRDAATNISHTHCHALIEIAARGSLPQSELAPLLRLDKSQASRVVGELESRGWIRARADAADARARVLGLTPRGKTKLARVDERANARVDAALAALDEDERRVVVSGMALYARALERSRRAARYTIRPIRPADRAAVARLIRTVMPEFGAKGPGFAILDPEVDDMFGAYRGPRAAYFVVTRDDGTIAGGGGFAPLVGGGARTCELRKMYFLTELRGLGVGQRLLELCIEGARRARFKTMYLETLATMTQAKALYERHGFRALSRPKGNTGHYGCNAFYARDLR